MKIELTEQLHCAERELSKRRHFYPKWVAEKRMRQATADHEIAAMEAIIATLRKASDLQEVGQQMLDMSDKKNQGGGI